MSLNKTLTGSGWVVDAVIQGPYAGRTITASTSLASTDAIKRVVATHASVPIVLTIPDDTTAGWGDEAALLVYQGGAAAVTFAAGANVTLRTGPSIPSPQQYGCYGVMRIGANEWATF